MGRKDISFFASITVCTLAAALVSSCGIVPKTASLQSASSGIVSEDNDQTAPPTSAGKKIVSEEDKRTASSPLTERRNTASSNASGSMMISEEQQKKYEELQSSVDNGHQPGLLDPEEVATDFLATDLNIKDLYKVYDKSEKSVAGDHTTVTLLKEGKPVWKIELYQPVKKGTGGIWVVTNWTDCKTNTKHAVA